MVINDNVARVLHAQQRVVLLLVGPFNCLLNCCFSIDFIPLALAGDLKTHHLIAAWVRSRFLPPLPPPSPSPRSCSAWERLSSEEGCLHQPAKFVLINELSASIWQSNLDSRQEEMFLKKEQNSFCRVVAPPPPATVMVFP